MYEDGNHLALVLYDCAGVATADVREGDEQQVVCMLERDGLDQQKGYNSGDVKKMGRKKSRSPSDWTNIRVIVVAQALGHLLLILLSPLQTKLNSLI